MRIIFILLGLCGLFLFTYLGINSFASSRQEEKQQCISPRALKGCEQAGADVEQQLRRCEWSFTRCVESNVELQEKLKEKEK